MSEEYDDDPIGEHEPELMPDVEAHSELRPCPFCGGKGGNIYDTEKHDPSCYFIKTASMKVMYGTVEEWNKRPIEDALRKQLDELQTGYDNYHTWYLETKEEVFALRKQLEEAKNGLMDINIEFLGHPASVYALETLNKINKMESEK